MSTARVQPDSKPVFGVHPPPSPNRFVETMQAYQRTAALKAAIDFDLFTAIGEGVETAEQLAQRNHASVRGMRVLCDFLVIMGFLNKAENCYTLTNESATFLDKNSLAYVGSATRFLGSEMVTGAYSDFAAVVRAGGPPTPRPAFHSEHPIWVEFARSMAPLSHFVAQQAERVLHTNTAIKVLDVTASHGLFGIVIARNNPQANIVALDWPTVLNVAQENAERFGVADRYALLPGDVFDVTYGHDYDLILVPNILHMWDRTTIQKFLEKAHGALAPKGRIAVIEMSPNEDRVTPPVTASFAMYMLANTKGGDAYTRNEYREMLGKTGFSGIEVHPLLPTPFSAIVAVKG